MGEQGLRPGEAIACMAACLVALLEQPDPAAVSLLPALAGTCGEWFGLGSLFCRSVPASGVAQCQRYPSASYTSPSGAWEDAEPHVPAARAAMLALILYSPLVTTEDKSPSHRPTCSCINEPSFQIHTCPLFFTA